MQVNEIAPAEVARMRAMVRPVQDKFVAAYDQPTVATFRSELERVQK